MIITNIHETKTNLSALLNRALAGDEVIIARGNEPLARLVPYVQDSSPRTGGQWAGQVSLPDNFEFTDEELNELFYADPKAAQ